MSMSLVARIVGDEAQLLGAGCDDLVYLLVEALDAGGFKVDFRATRSRKLKREPRSVMVTGTPESINKVNRELVRVSKIVPVISDVSPKSPDVPRAALVTFS